MADKADKGEPDLATAIAHLARALEKQGDKQNDLLAALHKSQPPRIVEYGDPDYQARLAKEKREFQTPTFQNGFEASAVGLSDETIRRVAHLKPGRYVKNLIEVQVSPKGHVNFAYKNKTPDQRFALMVEFKDFTDLVNRIWDEQQLTASA